MAKLPQRVRAQNASVGAELAKVKAAQNKAAIEKQKAEADKKKKEAEAKQKQQEEKELKEFQQHLPKAKASVTAVEAAAEKVIKAGSPLLSAEQEAGEALDKKLEAVEKEAGEAMKKLTEARTELNTKLANAKKYVPEARKVATTELNQLQQKLQEAQKKLAPYKAFKNDFTKRVEARKALAEVAAKLDTADEECKKATDLAKAADSGKMSDEQVAAVDEAITGAQKELGAVLGLISQRARGADQAKQAELDVLRTRHSDIKKRLDASVAKVKTQRDALTLEKNLVLAREKTEKAEKLIEACQEAEMPFLKGIEVLPKAESDKALGESESTASQALLAVNQARSFLKAKLMESKKLAADVAQSVSDTLSPLSARVDAVETKLTSFRKDTAERKTNALLAEVVESVATAEGKVGALKEAAEVLSGSLQDVSVDTIKAALEKSAAADKEAAAACNEARKVLAEKSKQGKMSDGGAGAAKLQNRLNAVQTEMTKLKQAVQNGQRAIKIKEVLEKEGPNLKKAEEAVETAEKLAGAEGDELKEEQVIALDEAATSAALVLKTLPSAVQPLLATAPAESKAELQKLLDGKKAVQEKLDKVKAATKTRRESVLVGVFQREGEKKADALEKAIEKTGDAELPFLKGIEVLPLDEAHKTVEASEKAAAAGQEVLSDARGYLAAKTLELRQFNKEVAKPAMEAFAKLTSRINGYAQQLATFGKDTATRKRAAQVQEADVKVAEVEAEAKKTLAAAEPFMKEDAESLSEEAAAEPLQNFLAVEKEAKAKMAETRAFVTERQRACKDSASQVETLKKLQERMQQAQAEMTKARKATSDHEQRFIAKRLVEEVNEKIATLDGEIKQATDACAKLLEHGGVEFLVGASVRTLANALSEYMKAKELDMAALFKQVGGPKNVSEAAFLKWLAALPEASGREEIAFTEERRAAIFKRLDADADGKLSAQEFQNIFRERYTCKKSISLTDGFDVAEGKTVAKVEPGDVLETTGSTKADEAGMLRCECKLVEGGQTGWITLKGNQGTTYADVVLPITAYSKEMDKAISDAVGNVQKVNSFLSNKVREGGSVSSGPLVGARAEINKLRPKVSAALGELDNLKKKVLAGKKELQQKERAELNAHVVAKMQREAEVITGPATGKVDEAVAAGKAVEEKGAPLTELKKEELEEFAEPATLKAAVEKLSAELAEKAEQARKAVKEQLQAANEVKPMTPATTEAKKQLQQMSSKVEAAARNAKKTVDAVKAKCDIIVDKVSASVAEALRKEGPADQLFEKLSKGGDAISEADLEKKIVSLSSPSVKPEHAKLLCRRIAGTGQISRRSFLGYVQTYYSVVKEIALTNDFDVGTTKTLRKVEKDELLETLEGPVADDKIGLARVRVRSLLDGAEGWVSLKGNQGTAFLVEVDKPFFTTRAEVSLDNAFEGVEGGAVRTLGEDEVLELLEGPRKIVLPDALRARVKASKDNVQGWVTIRDQKEVVYAAPNTSLFKCTSSVAMTDGENINECKVLRKLAVGELFETTAEPKADAETGVKRVHGKALSDGKEGWITTQGNAGTVYAEAAKCHAVLKEVELHKRFSSVGEPEVVRKLEVGESLQVLEGPKEEKSLPEVRLKVRAMSDRAVGWITRKDGKVKAWKPAYRCVDKVAVTDTRSTEGAKELRELAKGEVFELYEGPVAEAGATRMKGRAVKDGLVGWTTLKNQDGKRLMDC
eukprot:TRINITY_DN1241_c0_g3_i4.p1 TRINITY_DN1241_c0_g3~~TRINITY_DN1241_c0_g3_i4.p1  ORF type:complete len:1829 (+),score=752.40 TRINITY_DN1241_c0_g3_i4:367-5487(+)